LAPERPDEIWASDITCVATAEGGLYRAMILDLFSRRVVGWQLDDRLDVSRSDKKAPIAYLVDEPGRRTDLLRIRCGRIWIGKICR